MNLRRNLLSSLALLFLSSLASGQSGTVVVVTPSPTGSSGATAQGQAAPSNPNTPHAFDVATVKPAAPLDFQKLAADFQAGKMPRMGPHVDSSRAEYIYMSLKELIVVAYGVKPY
jgi:hypothetical protein